MTMHLRHDLEDRLSFVAKDVTIAEYRYRPGVPKEEGPMPFFHPMRTLSGEVVTLARPVDHVWHHGLSLSFAALSGANFWGGPAYVRDTGYTWLENIGEIQHRRFSDLYCKEMVAGFAEQLDWRSVRNEVWLTEHRQIDISLEEVHDGCWSMRFQSKLTNATRT